MDVLGILVSLILLMILAYRGFSVIVIAPLLALLAAFLQTGSDTSLFVTFSTVFMPKLGDFVVKFFPLFLLGSIFGKLLDLSGMAKKLAESLIELLGEKHVILSVILACGALTYGGVSAFVVCFAVEPLARQLFNQTSTPKALLPAAIAAGALTFSMTALPGAAQIHNLLPTKYFQTTPFAAPVLGTLAGVSMLVLCSLWLNFRASKISGKKHKSATPHQNCAKALWPLIQSSAPLMVVVGSHFWLAESETASKIWAQYPDLKSTGAMLVSLIAGILFTLIFNLKTLKTNLSQSLSDAANDALLPTFNTGSEVGFGSVIASLAGFAPIKAFVIGIAPHSPLISEALSINLLAGITGSASGGLAIALETLGPSFVTAAENYQIPMEYMHRIASLACGGLDSLPHNGAVITLLTVCKMTHRESYKDIGIVTVLIPILVTAVSVAVLSFMMGS